MRNDDSVTGGRRLRVGLVGCGKMGLHHLTAIAETGRGTIVGIADPAASADDLRDAIGPDAIVVSSPEELIARARPEVVHIVTPPSTHAAIARTIVDAGCHVYIEKPFTPTIGEAEAILELAAARGVKVCAGHQVLFEPPAAAARDAVPSIGRVVHIESVFSFRTVRRTITPVDQAKDILPHAVYPLVDQLHSGSALRGAAIELNGLSVDASGEIRALLRLGDATATLLVTLNGRPIEHYLHIIATNGSVKADFIAGHVVRLVGPGTGAGVLATPYRRAWQILRGSSRGLARRILKRGASYPGLAALIGQFYDSILERAPLPLTPASILDTVRLCERIGDALDVAERAQEAAARSALSSAEMQLPSARPGHPVVLVTGGTGLLGKRTVEELRAAGVPVRAVARRQPPYSRRAAGVEYISGDLARGLDPVAFLNVGTLVHCAAETAGGKADHQRNSIDATRRLIETAAAAGVRRMIHVSSLAVLKTSREMGRPLDESTPIERSERRGPYVWGKAESEILIREVAPRLGVDLKIIRPGPLVDYDAFQTPGRLGREVGPFYVGIGPKRGPLSVCDVSTAARVIRSYVDDFSAAPEIINLVEAPPPARGELLARYLRERPDLKVFWIPGWLLTALAGPLKLAQRVVLGAKQPVDIAAAFASERYQTDVAARVIARASAPAPASAPSPEPMPSSAR
jgi:predicted dehydrogenase/nucleoside-diphosphate-sugar epimerase